MAKSRNARRKLAAQYRLAKAERLVKRDEALQQEKVKRIVQDNLRKPPERNYWKGCTQDIWAGVPKPMSQQRHCEAKQRVTVFGKERNLSGRTINKGKY